MKELREWLKTQPDNSAFKDTTLISKAPSTTTSPVANRALLSATKPKINNLVSLAKFPIDGYFDMVCQVCALCSTNETNFVYVWDGCTTK